MAQRSYDVFLSYARVDNQNNQFVSKLAKEIQRASQLYMGSPLRIFLDTRDIETAQFWEERIKIALENSAVMVAVLTPSYFHSPWCAREWDSFLRLEQKRRAEIRLDASEALVFPVRFIPLEETIRLPAEGRRRMNEAMSRQFKDLVDVDPESPRFEALIRELVSEIARVFMRYDELSAASAQTDPFNASLPPHWSHRSRATDEPRITTRMGSSTESFIRRLSEAAQVTILGITNERLTGFLEEALKRRRQENRAYWSLVRVVFASESLLHLVHDELDAEFPNRTRAIRERFQRAGQGRRAVASFFLLSNGPHRWSMYEYPFLLPFVGALFEMPDGSRIVQVATLRPSYRVAEYLYFELTQEMAGESAYYQAAFEDVVERSELQNEVTLAGVPLEPGPGFLCHGSRFRHSVMRPGRGRPSDWLPAVLVCTYWDRPGSPEPLLQVRTRQNSSHEIGVLSHISALINQEDSGEFEAEFVLPEEAAKRAARRTVLEDLGADSNPTELELIDQLRLHALDHESLYFYLYKLGLPRGRGFPKVSYIQPWTLTDLLQLRKYQVLSYLANLLEGPALTARQAELAGRIIKQNLVLHDLSSLGEALSGHIYRQDRPLELLEQIQQLRHEATIRYPGAEGEIIQGLGRLQYREFFSALLPLYEQIGVLGAKEELAKIRASVAKQEALRELLTLYRSETAMRDQATEV